ncbi:MAG: LysE family transporter [Rhodospirillaceae bacterium]
MMSFDLYIAYVLASALLILMPGPIVTLTVANSLAHGATRGMLTVLGASAGSAVLLGVGALGMAWLLDVLSHWFDWIRWIGAAYLIFLGLRQWNAKPADLAQGKADKGPVFSVMAHGFLVAVTNPKTILFYAALFPQFIDASAPLGPQLTLMSVTFVVLALILDNGYAIMAGRVGRWLGGAKQGRIRNRITGGLLMITGAGLALVRRS